MTVNDRTEQMTMGYFSNGTEGRLYQERFCDRCIHDNPQKDIYCPIWNLHLLHNSQECNKPDSFLHALIPLSADKLDNERCKMFVDRGALSNLQIETIEHAALSITANERA